MSKERFREGGKFKTMRSDTTNRFVLKKWIGPFIGYTSLWATLPGKHWQKDENHTPDRVQVHFKCDVCGFIHTIGKNHTIEPNGNVNASFGREKTDNICGIHEWLHLEDWNPEDSPKPKER